MKNNAGRAILVSIYALALYYFVYNLFNYYFVHEYSGYSGTMSLLVSAIVTIPFVLYPYSFSPKVSGRRHTSKWEAALWVILIVVLGLALNYFMGKIPLFAGDVTYQGVRDNILSGGFWLNMLTTCIVVPTLEELVYRGVIFNQMTASFGVIAGIVVSALAFGAMHMNLPQFVYAAIMGVALALVYNRMKNIGVAIMAHGLTNLAVLLVSTYIGW